MVFFMIGSRAVACIRHDASLCFLLFRAAPFYDHPAVDGFIEEEFHEL